MGVFVLAACTIVQPEAPAHSATWTFAPGQQIGADTTEFTAMVTERTCASGRSSEGRIVGPQVDYVDDTSVVVTFSVRPLDGMQECPGNPATAVVVRLEESLGDRRLLDGGRAPPLEPPDCANPLACE